MTLDYKDSSWVAEALNLDVSRVERLMERGELPGFQVGDTWLVSEARLSKFLEEKDRGTTGEETAIRRKNKFNFPPQRSGRAKVRYQILGGEWKETSWKDMLLDLLQALAARDQSFLQGFSREGGRKRHYVAEDPTQLYPGRPDLVRGYKEPLDDRWWVGTNYNSREIESITRRACEVAGLRWGIDFVLDNQDETARIERALSFVGIGADPDPNASIRHAELFADQLLDE